MLAAIFITLVIIAALGSSIQAEQKGGLITRHRYNNRDNDAPGAREDHLG
jgi:high-affinity Fe2+/Pb2+ permease